METWEYSSIRLWINQNHPVDFDELKSTLFFNGISKDSVQLEVREVFRLVDSNLRRATGINKGQPVYYLSLRKALIDIVLPSLQELGKEGWEVVEYKSSEDPIFLEVLLKRKVQKD